MTRFASFILSLVLIAPSAFAAAPHPTAIDADKDGTYAATVDVNGDKVKDYLDIGVRKSEYDCDDGHNTVSPKLAEVVGDGIDNDCSGADANWPAGVTDVIAARFIANSGAKSPTVFIAEYDACKAATTECEIDQVGGTFTIAAAKQDTHKFADIYVNGSKVLRNNGQKADGREVVTVEEYEHFRGGSASGSGSYTGPSKATREKEALAVATPLVTAEAEARLAADVAHDAAIAQIRTGNDARDAELNRQADVDVTLKKGIDSNDAALVDEIRRAKAAEAEALREALAAKASAKSAQTDASSAVTTANSAAAHGPLLEVGVLGGVIGHRPLNESPSGDPIRGSAIGNGAFELRAGVDAKGVQVAGFGQMSFGSDGQGTGPDTSLLVGADVLFDAGPVEVGPFVAYLRSEDHANLLDLSVVENGGLIGIEFQGDLDQNGAFRAVPFARIGGGVGYYGTKGMTANGRTVVVSDYGGLGLAQFGFRFGAGALQR